MGCPINGRKYPGRRADENLRSRRYRRRRIAVAGFGMWWLKTFVERWDGEIKLKSNVGRGTTVSVRFPFKAPSHVIGVPSE